MNTLSDPATSALVVVDIQDRLSKAMPDFEDYLPSMVRAVQAARALMVDTLVTEQYPKGLGDTIPEIRAELKHDVPVFDKTSFSCWGSVAFAAGVEAFRPKTLVLIGMETHVCVQQTALQALERGYRVIVLADAICSRREMDRDAALLLMASRGVTVSTTEALAFDWLQNSRHPAFKQVSAIFK